METSSDESDFSLNTRKTLANDFDDSDQSGTLASSGTSEKKQYNLRQKVRKIEKKEEGKRQTRSKRKKKEETTTKASASEKRSHKKMEKAASRKKKKKKNTEEDRNDSSDASDSDSQLVQKTVNKTKITENNKRRLRSRNAGQNEDDKKSRRGRPRKNRVEVVEDTKKQPGKMGRPRKGRMGVSKDTKQQPRKVGRPRKKRLEVEEDENKLPMKLRRPRKERVEVKKDKKKSTQKRKCSKRAKLNTSESESEDEDEDSTDATSEDESYDERDSDSDLDADSESDSESDTNSEIEIKQKQPRHSKNDKNQMPSSNDHFPTLSNGNLPILSRNHEFDEMMFEEIENSHEEKMNPIFKKESTKSEDSEKEKPDDTKTSEQNGNADVVNELSGDAQNKDGAVNAVNQVNQIATDENEDRRIANDQDDAENPPEVPPAIEVPVIEADDDVDEQSDNDSSDKESSDSDSTVFARRFDDKHYWP